MPTDATALDVSALDSVCRIDGVSNASRRSELLAVFMRENARRMDAAALAVLADDRQQLLELAQATHGSAAVFGAPRLAHAAALLEHSAPAADRANVRAAVAAVRAAFDDLLSDLGHLRVP